MDSNFHNPIFIILIVTSVFNPTNDVPFIFVIINKPLIIIICEKLASIFLNFLINFFALYASVSFAASYTNNRFVSNCN